MADAQDSANEADNEAEACDWVCCFTVYMDYEGGARDGQRGQEMARVRLHLERCIMKLLVPGASEGLDEHTGSLMSSGWRPNSVESGTSFWSDSSHLPGCDTSIEFPADQEEKPKDDPGEDEPSSEDQAQRLGHLLCSVCPNGHENGWFAPN